MTTREDIIQGVRAWIKASSGATPLTDAQVIKADGDGVRPSLPYLTVRMLAFDVVVGTDERIGSLDGSGDPTVSVRGRRKATLTIQAFGDQATDWVAEFRASLYRDSAVELLHGLGLSVSLIGSGQANIVAQLANESELRSTHDLEVAYTFLSVEDSAIELLTYEHEATYTSDVATDLVVNATITV